MIHVYHEQATTIRDAIHAIDATREVVMATEAAELRAFVADAEVLLVSALPPGASLADAPRLRLLQTMGAGIEQIAGHDLPARAMIASGRGLFAAEVAEHAIAGLLALTRGLPSHLERQRERAWSPFASSALAGRSLAIVGVGAIGSRVARIAEAMEMRVLGIRRTPRPTAHLNEVGGPPELVTLLRKADHLVVCAPLTPATRGLIDEAALAALHRSACVVNVSRGGVLDELALLRALRAGQLGGALLDVFDLEPLPPDSPWWSAPNVIVTPHVAGLGVRYLDAVVRRLLDNVGRLARGDDPVGRVDRERGY